MNQPDEMPEFEGGPGIPVPPMPESAYAEDGTPLAEPIAEEQPAPPAQQPMDPFTIAGQALGVAVSTFNLLQQPIEAGQNRSRMVAAFDQATALAGAAASFGHALVAREQLQLMAHQVAQAEAAKKEVILTPGSLPNLRRT